MLRNKAGKLDDCAASRTVVPGYTFPVRDLARTNGTLRLLLSVCFIRGIKQHRTVNNERMITEIQHRLQTESNEILSDLYLQALDMLYSKPHH